MVVVTSNRRTARVCFSDDAMVCFSILSTKEKKRKHDERCGLVSIHRRLDRSRERRRRRKDDDNNNNNNNNRNKRRNISNQRVKVGAIGEVIRFRNFETSWNSNEKTLAFERKDERFRDVQFRENQFRLLEPLLVPLLGEEGITELILTCPEVLGMDARQLGWTLVLLSGDGRRRLARGYREDDAGEVGVERGRHREDEKRTK